MMIILFYYLPHFPVCSRRGLVINKGAGICLEYNRQEITISKGLENSASNTTKWWTLIGEIKSKKHYILLKTNFDYFRAASGSSLKPSSRGNTCKF